jgi:3-phenylpropionate/cinnamic acid dioxygenase small subunit
MTAQREQALELLFEYVTRIDRDQLESWLDLFAEDATYQVVPRENVEQNLPASLILCTNKNMLRDRIVSLREANEYNLHYCRHLVSAPRFETLGADRLRLRATFSCYQTDLEGNSKLFAVGEYDDEVRFVAGQPSFARKYVVLDTYSVPNLLAVPL